MSLFYHSNKRQPDPPMGTQKSGVTPHFELESAKKRANTDFTSVPVFSRVFPSPIPLARIESASLRAFRPPPMLLNRLYKLNHAIFRQRHF
jgi:hypothetical protein